MKRLFLAAIAGLLVLTVAGAGHWYLSVARELALRPVPGSLIAADDAFAVPGLMGQAHFALGYAVRAELLRRGRPTGLAEMIDRFQFK